MKKATSVLFVLCAVAALLLTLSLYFFKNTVSTPLYIRYPDHSAAVPQDDAARLVNINTAGIEDLTALPGIGATLAQRIIDYREQNGPFSSPAALLNVEGIGEGTLETILDLITTGGTT